MRAKERGIGGLMLNYERETLMKTLEGAGTILVVEDHEDTACLLRFILERDGYDVTHIGDGRMAQDLIATTSPPDLILLDIMLPALTGLELLRIVRTTPEWQWIPVILLTSESRTETMAEAVNLGATEYVLKPFAAKRLLKSVRRFFPIPVGHQGDSLNAPEGLSVRPI